MEHMGKISPAIPALRKVQRHVEKQFKLSPEERGMAFRTRRRMLHS
jgi:hypothetical protein